jgi:hypothetical protein
LGYGWDTAKGVIKVDAGTPTTADPKAVADGLAKNFGGTVRSELSVVDGERGFQVQAPSQGAALSPRRGIVVFREGQVFLIMAGAVDGTDVSTALEHVRATWKWGR